MLAKSREGPRNKHPLLVSSNSTSTTGQRNLSKNKRKKESVPHQGLPNPETCQWRPLLSDKIKILSRAQGLSVPPPPTCSSCPAGRPTARPPQEQARQLPRGRAPTCSPPRPGRWRPAHCSPVPGAPPRGPEHSRRRERPPPAALDKGLHSQLEAAGAPGQLRESQRSIKQRLIK